MKKQKIIADATPENMDIKIIEKLELKRDHSYLLLFKVGSMPFEQAKNLAELLADAGFKALFVAVQDVNGIKVIEKRDEETKTVKEASAKKAN